MGWEHHRRVNTFSGAWGHKPHKPLDPTVLHLLQAIKPQQMVTAKPVKQRDKLLTAFVIVNGAVIWGRWDLDHARVCQQVVLCS